MIKLKEKITLREVIMAGIMLFSGASVQDMTGFLQMCSDEAQQWVGIKTTVQNGVIVGGVYRDEEITLAGGTNVQDPTE